MNVSGCHEKFSKNCSNAHSVVKMFAVHFVFSSREVIFKGES